MANALRITTFGGMVPRLGRRLLGDTQAQVAANCRLTNGQLEPLYDTLLISNPQVDGVQAVYKMVQDGEDVWLAWDRDVDAAKGPIAGDETNRTYYSGDFEPRVTNYELATNSAPFPDEFYVLGVTPPITAPGVSHAGGAGAAVSRAFLYTFVTQWGEESAPSPASSVTVGKVDGTWTVDTMDVAPLNSFTTTAGSWAAGTATLTVASTFGLRVGEEINVVGVTPSGYNTASAAITALTSTTVAYAVTSDPGAYSGAGTISRIAPHNTSGMTKNIYWTQTSSSGTLYQLVKSGVAVADVSTTVAGNATPEEELVTSTWEMPPVDMQGLVFHPCGSAVGFAKNELYISEPYAPYAYPTELRLVVDYDIVGIGVFGTTIVLGTKGNPYVAAGVTPEGMTLSKVDQPWPCLSKKGVVGMGYGVMFPVPQGLALIGVGGSELVTDQFYSQNEWEELNPSTFRSGSHSGAYVASYETTEGDREMLILDRSEFATVVKANKHCDVVYGDPQSGELYIVKDDLIYLWDSTDSTLMSFDWMSKELMLPTPFNPGAARVDAEFTLTPAENEALEAARLAFIEANQALIDAGTYDIESTTAMGVVEIAGVSFDEAPSDEANTLQFQLWVDNDLEYSVQLETSAAFRLPSGYKTDAVAVRLTGNVKVLSVVVGETMQSLKTV